MAWLPTYQPVWTYFPTQTQGPGVGISEAIQIMRNYDYPPPSEYIFLKPLGAGGCGKVYLAKHCFTGCLYAVKCVKIIDAYTALLAQRLWKEIVILKANPHPHLITCYGSMQSSTDLSIMYLFLEYMNMGSVRDLYLNPKNITEAVVRECISHVLVGLVHLHSLFIVHRDLKGENILKDSKGFYKIADFGLSKRCYEDATSGSYGLMTTRIGTHTHMAPEVNNRPPNVSYDMQADIW